jgi:hypothetical protein
MYVCFDGCSAFSMFPKIVMSLSVSAPNRYELQFLQHKIDTIKVEHEAHVLPLMMATPNEGEVTDKRHCDLSLSSTFPLIKCETEVSLFFICFGL